jgi:hypothetical protein
MLEDTFLRFAPRAAGHLDSSGETPAKPATPDAEPHTDSGHVGGSGDGGHAGGSGDGDVPGRG